MFLEVKPARAKAQGQECKELFCILALSSLDDARAPRFSVLLSAH